MTMTVTAKRARTLVPWAVSAAAHAGVVLLAVFTTLRAVRPPEQAPPVEMLLAPFDLSEERPLTTLAQQPLDESLERLAAEDTSASELSLGSLILPSPAMAPPATKSVQVRPPAGVSVRPPAGATVRPNSGGAPVSFAGITSRRADKVTFVIDASGSMIGGMPSVIDELERTLRRMSGEQRFRVIFFQRNAAVDPEPAGMLSATSANIDRVLRWCRERLIPAGRSNPIAAIESAIADRPDAVFLMSTPITGAGDYEMNADEIVARVDDLNHADASGRRVQIQCIQMLDTDPDDVLRRIAERNGGPGAYRYVSREDLGLLAGRSEAE